MSEAISRYSRYALASPGPGRRRLPGRALASPGPGRWASRAGAKLLSRGGKYAMAKESEFGGGDKDREDAAPQSAEQALHALYAAAREGS